MYQLEAELVEVVHSGDRFGVSVNLPPNNFLFGAIEFHGEFVYIADVESNVNESAVGCSFEYSLWFDFGFVLLGQNSNGATCVEDRRYFPSVEPYHKLKFFTRAGQLTCSVGRPFPDGFRGEQFRLSIWVRWDLLNSLRRVCLRVVVRVGR